VLADFAPNASSATANSVTLGNAPNCSKTVKNGDNEKSDSGVASPELESYIA